MVIGHSQLLNKNMSTILSKVFQRILIHVIVEKEFYYIFNLKTEIDGKTF